MEEFEVLLIFAAVVGLLCGPVALILALIALVKSNRLAEQFRFQQLFTPRKEMPSGLTESPPPPEEKPPVREPITLSKQPPTKPKPAPTPAAAAPRPEKPVIKKPAVPAPPVSTRLQTPDMSVSEQSLEQRIGTQWILIAGIITVLFGVGFFLKYAYDHNWLQPWARVGIIAIGGIIALVTGEVTRRREYEIVAKGTTALGFALLYAAAFAAYRIYGLIDPVPAYAIAICITIGAMAYALILDEVLIAFLSLFGGYLTPILLSTGQNLPIPLFTYVLILSLGAMACAYFRWWRAVNIVAFAGTYLLYTAWFEKFYHPAQRIAEGLPSQMSIALGWLAVFFVIYLVMPLLYGLLRKTLSHPEDVWLAAINGLMIFYYLYRILYPSHRTEMALACVGLFGIYLAVMLMARLRCPEDSPLHVSLLVMALAFLTVALPLHFEMRALVMAWAIEGVILCGIGLLYRSRWTQAAGLAASFFSILTLCYHHEITEYGSPLILNPAFGIWFFVCAAILTQHLFYRFLKIQTVEVSQPFQERQTIGNILYALSIALLFIGFSFEWFAHCKWHLDMTKPFGPFFFQGMIILIILFIFPLLIRPICPKSLVCSLCAILLSTAGSVYTFSIMPRLYHRDFLIFANSGFLISCLFVAALFLCGWLLVRRKDRTEETVILAAAYALGGVVMLWLLLSEQIYFYWKLKNQYAGPVYRWDMKAYMYLSVLWAIYGALLMIIGFWRKLPVLRYLALALFALLIGKIILFDMGQSKTEYKIAAFLVTGLILVAVSYLYQFAKKKGFFEAFQLTADKQQDDLL